MTIFGFDYSNIEDDVLNEIDEILKEGIFNDSENEVKIKKIEEIEKILSTEDNLVDKKELENKIEDNFDFCEKCSYWQNHYNNKSKEEWKKEINKLLNNKQFLRRSKRIKLIK